MAKKNSQEVANMAGNAKKGAKMAETQIFSEHAEIIFVAQI